MTLPFILLPLLAGCPEKPPPCPECQKPAVELADWEVAIVAPAVEELRAGIRKRGDEGWGICTGERTCEKYMGTDPGELAPGKYLVRADLDVPKIGAPWKVRFDVACTTTAAGGKTSEQKHTLTYEVRHGGPNRGWRMENLWKIDAPHQNGARSCSFKLTPIRPDGVEAEAWTGSYTTAAGPAQ